MPRPGPEQWVAMLGFMDSRGGERTPEVLRSWYSQRGVTLEASLGKGAGWDKEARFFPPSTTQVQLCYLPSTFFLF